MPKAVIYSPRASGLAAGKAPWRQRASIAGRGVYTSPEKQWKLKRSCVKEDRNLRIAYVAAGGRAGHIDNCKVWFSVSVEIRHSDRACWDTVHEKHIGELTQGAVAQVIQHLHVGKDIRSEDDIRRSIQVEIGNHGIRDVALDLRVPGQ